MAAKRFSEGELTRFAREILLALGSNPAQADANAKGLVWCDLVGRHNHGLIRLPALVKRATKGVLSLDTTPSVEPIAPGSEIVDAHDGLGQYAGQFGTQRAIALAQETGIGAVGVKNSNYYGIGAYYTHLMAEAGMIGLALSNSMPKVAAHGGREAVLGTNPFAFGAPMPDGRSLMFDISTAGLAGSTVREHSTKGWPLPEGYLVDSNGAPVTDPAQAGAATLLPAAGPKGFGLGLMVEILCGVLTGGAFSHQVLSIYKDFSGPARSGHFFVAIDIARWMEREVFYDRISQLSALIAASGEDVRLPGESRWRAAEENRAQGIPVADDVLAALESLSKDHSVAMPAVVSTKPATDNMTTGTGRRLK